MNDWFHCIGVLMMGDREVSKYVAMVVRQNPDFSFQLGTNQPYRFRVDRGAGAARLALMNGDFERFHYMSVGYQHAGQVLEILN
jgi:hypothetical protein